MKKTSGAEKSVPTDVFTVAGISLRVYHFQVTLPSAVSVCACPGGVGGVGVILSGFMVFFTLIWNYLRHRLPPPRQHDIPAVILRFMCASELHRERVITILHAKLRRRQLKKTAPVEEMSTRAAFRVPRKGIVSDRVVEIVRRLVRMQIMVRFFVRRRLTSGRAVENSLFSRRTPCPWTGLITSRLRLMAYGELWGTEAEGKQTLEGVCDFWWDNVCDTEG
ncbi:hypothetical protein TGGT1_274700 [Toxoplasma gondii GT1]|uniref:Transmembrane protein n=1 Tax=Toxoplasma gondii (strain ATCC 50853 / GT1) TaxID=507601 RepID=S7UGJ7_TOXGG|nr:hypothetical protein TGGT1_274700 [Toxoplasma gondii GT1]